MGADGFVDSWIKDTTRIDLLADLWNNENLSKM